jgi:hypothetical protein
LAPRKRKDRTIRPIELQKVAALCRRHTEMSPCQSARNACRSSGGRVYAADRSEIDLTPDLVRNGIRVRG